MVARKNKILDFYAGKTWAIQEESLQEMYAIYRARLERQELNLEIDVEAVSARAGKPLDNTRTVEVRDGVAIIPVSGPIFRYANLFTMCSGATSIEVLARDFRQALDDPSVKAILFEINSPGGEVDGTSELAQHIFEARGQKPIIAYAGHLMCSAAYWLGSACDEIVCNDTASLGSIGVVGGVRVAKNKDTIEFVSSQSPNKRPDPESQTGKAQIQRHIDDLADVFINTVARNRNWTAEEVIQKGGAGGLKVGQFAVEAGLADRMGTFEGLIAELSQNVNGNNRVGYRAAEKPTITEGEKTTMADKDPKDVKTAEAPPAKVEAAKDDPPKAVDHSAELEAAKAEAAEAKRQLAEAEATNADLRKQGDETAKRVGELEKQARTSRFTEMSKGWPGETKDNLAMLEHLATSSGEESEVFKAHVKTMSAAKAQIETGALFKELGSSQAPEGSAAAEIEARARKTADESAGKTTYQQAYDQIFASDSALRGRLAEEERRQNN